MNDYTRADVDRLLREWESVQDLRRQKIDEGLEVEMESVEPDPEIDEDWFRRGEG